MYIQPNENNINMTGWSDFTGACRKAKNRVKQAMIDVIPEATIKESAKKIELWKKIDDIISRPAQNRAIMGATALITQPAIDYCNHKVDDETRRVSRNRTIAKIIAGTCVGIVVRGSCYKLVKMMTDPKGASKFSKAFIPKAHLNEALDVPKFLKNHTNACSSLAAVLAMCFTNFAIDAPLTVYLTNKFNGKRAEIEAKTASDNERKVIYG